MKPLVPNNGGKGRLADWIVSLMPPTGSTSNRSQALLGRAVLLAKPYVPHEMVLSDIDGSAVTFCRARHNELECRCN